MSETWYKAEPGHKARLSDFHDISWFQKHCTEKKTEVYYFSSHFAYGERTRKKKKKHKSQEKKTKTAALSKITVADKKSLNSSRHVICNNYPPESNAKFL